MQNLVELPARVTIYPTSHCFKKCRHCIFVLDKTLNTASIDFDRLMAVLNDLAQHKVLLVGIAGGDPLKYPRILDLIREVIRLGMIPILTLSGANLTEKVVRQLFEAGVRSVQLSLDGASANHHDAFRGDGSFIETVAAIKMLSQCGISVSLASCLTKENVSELDEIIVLAENLGINKMKVQRWNAIGENSSCLNELTLKEFSSLVQAHKQSKKTFNTLEIYFDKGDLQITAANGLAIMANGDLKLSEFSETFGNIYHVNPSYYYQGGQ
ncbi:MAG: radical SAM protein [Bdellovibrio sp.]